MKKVVTFAEKKKEKDDDNKKYCKVRDRWGKCRGATYLNKFRWFFIMDQTMIIIYRKSI